MLKKFAKKNKLAVISASIVSATLLSACAVTPEDESNKKPTELYVFDCGDIEVRDLSIFSPGFNKGVVKKLTNSCYLIKHDKGTLLWDAGLNDALGPQGIDVWDGAFHLSVKNPLADQLKAIAVNPSDIDYLGVSHFHGDHTGNANLFNQSSLVMQQEEFDAAFGEEPEKFSFDPSSYDAFDKTKVKVISGDFDVFGDGKVVIKRAIGHTPGHQVLFVDLEETGPILLSGDLYHFTENRTHKRVPSFNFNKAQTLESMDTIESFVKEKNADFWIQHDLEQNESIKHSPEFYQ